MDENGVFFFIAAFFKICLLHFSFLEKLLSSYYIVFEIACVFFPKSTGKESYWLQRVRQNPKFDAEKTVAEKGNLLEKTLVETHVF